ncbi:unnamed protein product [Lactuca virosa]|uniref:Uncharacterized protein n=1 Tax=Lactuca virosa TaxID=75947 RepID=A0AAU9PPF0_9ASTR|nr:unnamed protein product [Lactuca virosa]
MTMVKSSVLEEEAIKALYDVSAIIRNNLNGLKFFYSEGGDLMLQGILSNAAADVRLRKRSVSLVADLAEYQLEYTSKWEVPFFSNCALVRLLVDLTASGDLDLYEKVNVEGTTKVTNVVLTGMIKRKKGAIVNIGSGVAVVMPSSPLYALYAATKAPFHRYLPFQLLTFDFKGVDILIAINKHEMLKMVRFGDEMVFGSKDSTITDEDIDRIIAKGEEATAKLDAKMKKFTENAIK